MHQLSGSQCNRAELEQRFKLPVFTVSAVDFQRLAGLRTSDGDSTWCVRTATATAAAALRGEEMRWEVSESEHHFVSTLRAHLRRAAPARPRRSDVEGTEVPSLRRFLSEATLRRRKVAMKQKVEALRNFTDNMDSYLADGGTESAAMRDAARVVFDKHASGLPAQLSALEDTLVGALAANVASAVGPQLKAGAAEATNECLSTCIGWRDGAQRMHWRVRALQNCAHLLLAQPRWRCSRNAQLSKTLPPL